MQGPISRSKGKQSAKNVALADIVTVQIGQHVMEGTHSVQSEHSTMRRQNAMQHPAFLVVQVRFFIVRWQLQNMRYRNCMLTHIIHYNLIVQVHFQITKAV